MDLPYFRGGPFCRKASDIEKMTDLEYTDDQNHEVTAMSILFPLSLLLPLVLSVLFGMVIQPSAPFYLFLSADPLYFLALLAAFFALTAFLFGLFTHEYSWVDRIWSLSPILYAGFLTFRGWPDPRLILFTLLILLWGIHLTFNFARKGGYSGTEDYRWAEVRKIIKNPILWQTFNFFFISFYQHALILLFTLPLYFAYQHRRIPLSPLDGLFAALFLFFLSWETLADQQQWDFHQKKKATKDSSNPLSEDLARGFLSSGLFRYSRHPNYFGEIMIWWTVYFGCVSCSGKWLHWSILGPILLTLLFQGSSWLTELLSCRKYPEYRNYQKETRKIIPFLPKKPLSSQGEAAE